MKEEERRKNPDRRERREAEAFLGDSPSSGLGGLQQSFRCTEVNNLLLLAFFRSFVAHYL